MSDVRFDVEVNVTITLPVGQPVVLNKSDALLLRDALNEAFPEPWRKPQPVAVPRPLHQVLGQRDTDNRMTVANKRFSDDNPAHQ